MIASGSALLIALVLWLTIGVILSVALGRRGHDGFSWFVLGSLLGPLAVAYAVVSWRTGERPEPHVLVRPLVGRDADSVDVLVGYDGSPESQACLMTTIELLGSRLGRLTLATVIPFDGGREVEPLAIAGLQEEGRRLAWLSPGTEVIRGHPAEALIARAVQAGYDLVAVGTRGAGRAHPFGSVSAALARHSTVPVLLGASAKPSPFSSTASSPPVVLAEQ